ncbi:mechanosensitive ion channel family protein [Colwellia sp. MB02u-10]|jgi:small-conductance mechanosensitive channel|uniref:mechanosensitive ion channel family protein n=1 Tax=Colwellia sp. MB02u-10 TaxID=2759828 RepID=UPI0015F43597|nr:mechanosensitive ion channel family protein [Colwellia sp. MB02u-10]MBA6339741.1 mechanosensitive ion channel family protein [Colwellia sp. MB02u-10]
MIVSLLENKSFVTAVLAIAIITVKLVITRLIRRRAKKKKLDKRLSVNLLNNLFNFALICVVFNIWSVEIQKFAFSIAAFVVAIVLATREFIQCLIGFIYVVSNRPFRIGDWIQVGNYCGEVNSIDWINLTLLEVNISNYQFTGKTLYIPNNQLVASAIKNLNFLKRYAVHHFTITRDGSVNPFEFIDALKIKANTYCADFNDVAVRYNQVIESRLDIKIAGPDPHIEVATSELGDTQIIFTIFCPTERAMEIENKLTADFMNFWFSAKSHN